MANEIDFVARFKLAQQSLKEMRRAVDAAFATSIKVDIEPKTKRQGVQRQPTSGRQGPGTSEKLLSNLAKAQEQVIKSAQKLTEANLKQAANLEKITAITSKGTQASEEEQASLGKLKQRQAGLESSVRASQFQFDKLTNESNTLSKAIEILRLNANLASAGLSAIGKQGEFKLDVAGLNAGFQILRTLVDEVIAKVFTPMSGVPADAIKTSLEVLSAEIIREKNVFGRLGFNIKDAGALISLGAQEFRDSLEKAGIDAIKISQQGTILGAPPKTEQKEQVKLDAAISKAKQLELQLAAEQVALQQNLGILSSERTHILEEQNKLQATITSLLKRSQDAERQLEAGQQAARNSLFDRATLEDSVVKSLERQTKLLFDVDKELETSKARYRSQTIRLEEIDSIQTKLAVEGRAQLDALVSVKRATEKEARKIEDRIGAQPREGEALAVDAPEVGDIARDAGEALKRFRDKINGITTPIDGLEIAFIEGVPTQRKFNKVLNDAVGVVGKINSEESIVARELKAQAAGIIARVQALRAAGEADNAFIQASAAATARLISTANELNNMSRPIQAMSERAVEIAAAGTRLASDVAKSLGFEENSKKFGIAVDIVKEAFKGTGKNVEKAVQNLSNFAFIKEFVGEIGKGSLKFVDVVNTVNASMKKTDIATRATEKSLSAVASASTSFAKSLKGGGAASIIDEALGDFKNVATQVVSAFRVTGTELIEFGVDVDSLGETTERYRASLRKQIQKTDQFKFFEAFGINVEDIIGKILEKAGSDFQKDFINTSRKIDAQLLRGAQEFVKELVSRTSQAELIKPGFLDKALGGLKEAIGPKLTSEIIEKVLSPLQEKINQIEAKDSFDKLRDGANQFAGVLASNGQKFSVALALVQSQLGESAEAEKITREQFRQAARRRIAAQIELARRTQGTSIIKDTENVNAAIDRLAAELIKTSGQLENDARTLLAPLKAQLEKIQFDKLEKEATAAAVNIAQLTLLQRDAGSTYAAALLEAGKQVNLTGSVLKEFDSTFRKGGFAFVDRMRQTALAFNEFEVNIDDIAERMVSSFGFDRNEAQIITQKLKDEVGKVRLEKDAKNLAARFVLAGKTLNEAMTAFKKKFAGQGLISPKAVQNIESAFEKAQKELLKIRFEQLVKGQIDFKEIQRELTKRFRVDPQVAALQAAKLEQNATKERIARREKASKEKEKLDAQAAAAQRKVNNLLGKLAEAQRTALANINKSFSAENFLSQLKKSPAVGGSGPLKDFSFQGLKDFGQKLDLTSQERFISLLKQENSSLGTVNTQLKAHQGNIAKSNQTVDKLTAKMTSGQKAAFQFGFAAANAADRLAAWATPAALIFKVTSALREAVSTIIRIDETISRIAFFNAETLDRIAGGLNKVTGEIERTSASAKIQEGAFDSLNSAVAQYNVLTASAVKIQQTLINRAKETGIELEKLAEIALVAGRVNREAFDVEGNVNPFAEAIEGLLRIEGPLANASDLTAKLNSVLNQFQLTGEGTVLVAAQIGEVAQRSAFGAAELAEGLTRIGGAFSSVQGASVAESLEFLSAASNSAQTSVARVSTALRQLSVNVAEGADEIKEFAGLDIVEEGKLRGPRALIDVLEVVSSFEGQEAAIDFITQFTDKRNASIILGLARNIDTLKASFDELGTRAEREAKQTAQLTKFFTQQEVASRTLESELTKLKSTLIDAVGKSGFVDFLEGGIKGLNELTNAFGKFISLGDAAGAIFAGVFALFVPILSKVALGFKAGLLPTQKLAEVQQRIVTSLFQEGNAIKAINLLKTEGLLKSQQANTLSEKSLIINSKIFSRKQIIAEVEARINVLGAKNVQNAAQLNQLEATRARLQQGIVAEQGKQLLLQREIQATSAGTLAKAGPLGPNAGKKIATLVGGAIITGALIGAPVLGDLIGGEAGKSVESALSGLATGGLVGSIFGPIGAAIGAAVGLIANLAVEQNKVTALAKQEEEIREKVEKALAESLRTEEQRAKSSEQAVKDINKRKELSLTLTKELEIVDNNIRKLSEKGIKSEGLIAQKRAIQKDLQLVLAQQKALENRKLQDAIRFEEKIAKIKREQNTLSTLGNLIKDAEIALLDKTASISPVIEARITAEADEREIAIAKQAIEQQLGEINLKILGLQNVGADAQEVKKIEKERLKLQQELTDIELETIEQRFKRTQDALAAAEGFADKEEDRFKNISEAFTGRIKELVSSQKEIVDLLGKEADVFREIAEITSEGLDVAVRATAGGAVKDITDLNINQQRKIIKERNKILLDGARTANKILEEQFAVIGDVESFATLEERASSVNEKFAELGGVTAQFKDSLDRSTKFKLSELDAERQLFEVRKSQTLQSIQLEKSQIQILNQLNRDRIGLINQELDVLQRRIDKEAEIGEKLINAPAEFLKESRKIFSAEEVISAAKVDSSDVSDALLKIISEVNRVSGVAGVKEFFEGLKAAESRGQALVKGITPAQLSSLFSRLVANPNAQLVKESVSEQQKLINNIGDLIADIQSNNQDLISLIQVEEEIAALLNRNEIGREQLDELKSIVQLSRETAKGAIANVILAERGLNKLSSEIVGLKDSLLNKITKTQGDVDIETAINRAAALLSEIADADERVAEGRGETSLVRQTRKDVATLRAGKIPEQDAETFKTALDIQARRNADSFGGLIKEIQENNKIRIELSGLRKDTERLRKEIAKDIAERTLPTGETIFRESTIQLQQKLQDTSGVGQSVFGRTGLDLTADSVAIFNNATKRAAELAEALEANNSELQNFKVKFITDRLKSLEPSLIEFEKNIRRIPDIPTPTPTPAALLNEGNGGVATLNFAGTLEEAAEKLKGILDVGAQQTIPEPFDVLFRGALEGKDSEETSKKFAEATKPVVEGVNKTATVLEKVVTGVAGLFAETNLLKQQQASQHNADIAQRDKLAIEAASLQIDEASREDFLNQFSEKFNAATQNLVQQLVDVINSNTLSVEASAVEVALNAQITTEIKGDDFIIQLREAFIGTGLEDKVDEIAGILEPLIQFHVDNDTNVAKQLGAKAFNRTGK